MARIPIEQSEVFLKFESVADWVWRFVGKWDRFDRDTLGKQLVRAMDSVGSNLVEGDGRHSKAEAIHFFCIARGSAREARLGLERASKRKPANASEIAEQLPELTEATIQLNALIRFRRGHLSSGNTIREERADTYGVTSDPYVIQEGEDTNMDWRTHLNPQP